MLIHFLKGVTVVFCMLFVLNACAATKVRESWVDEKYQGKPVSKALVIGVTDEKNLRRAFESSKLWGIITKES